MTITKPLPGKGDLTEKEYLKKLENMVASETAEEEFKLDLETGLLKDFYEALKENPKLKFKDWYDNTQRQELNSGGVTGDSLAEDYGDLIDSYFRKIDVLENESLTDYINRIKAAEKKD